MVHLKLTKNGTMEKYIVLILATLMMSGCADVRKLDDYLVANRGSIINGAGSSPKSRRQSRELEFSVKGDIRSHVKALSSRFPTIASSGMVWATIGSVPMVELTNNNRVYLPYKQSGKYFRYVFREVYDKKDGGKIFSGCKSQHCDVTVALNIIDESNTLVYIRSNSWGGIDNFSTSMKAEVTALLTN